MRAWWVGAVAVTMLAWPGTAAAGSSPTPVGGLHLTPVHPDVLLTGVEVTQGVQSTVTSYQDPDGTLDPTLCATQPSLPVRDTSAGGITSAMTYQGVELEANHRKTLVRVFAHALYPSILHPTPVQVKNVAAVLYGTRDGQPLPGSPLQAIEPPRTLGAAFGGMVTCLDRADPKGAWTFTLPKSWRTGKITLRAKVLPDRYLFGPGGECATAYCAQDNTLELRGVPFVNTGFVTVTPVALTYTDGSTVRRPPAPLDVLRQSVYTAPTQLRYAGGGDSTYAGTIDITDIRNDPAFAYAPGDDNPAKQAKRRAQCSAIESRLQDWGDAHAHGDVTFGAFDPTSLVCLGVSGGSLVKSGEAFPVVNADSLAHEMGHAFGRSHSDSVANGCGGQGEDWPPDGRGVMHGIGTDTRTGSSGGNGAYKIVIHGALTPGDPFGTHQDQILYDLMSYCGALDRRYTLSDQGWNEALDGIVAFLHASHPERLASTTRGAGAPRADVTKVLRVRAAVDGDGVRITGVHHLAVAPAPLPGASPLTANFLGPRGGQLASIPMTGQPFVTHDGGDVQVYTADMPVGDTPVARIDIVQNGIVVASRARSANAPVVTLTAPTAGTTIGDGDTTVTWTASDADNDPLRAAVEFSANGGQGWRQVWVGPSTGTATIPRGQLLASQNARLRVHVSDGFNEAVAASGPLVVTPVAPTLRLVEGAAATTLRGDGLAPLVVSGQDGDGNPLQPSQVRWYDGARLIGTGLAIAPHLATGSHRLRIEAVSAAGLTSSLSTVLQIAYDPPHVLSFHGPSKIGPHVRRITVTIASTARATLRVRNRGWKVGRTPRTITIPVRPGRAELDLAATLTARGGTTPVTFVVARG